MAQASGKVLLFGEHAVVHGTAAIAAAIPAGVRVAVTDGAEHRVVLAPTGLSAAAGDGSRLGSALAALLEALPAALPPAALRIESDLPFGAGLGSSAAISVAIARALNHRHGLGLDDAELFEAAMAAERVFHGNASGLDPAVALHGGLLRFERGDPPRIQQISCAAPLDLVVAQIEAGADTRRMVEGVAAMRRAEPAIVAPVLEAIGALVSVAQQAIAQGERERLGSLMNINHGLLAALGVSTPALDAACHHAREAGALGAKLTGAGGGGCMIALVTPATSAAVASALRPRSLHLLQTRISGTGTGERSANSLVHERARRRSQETVDTPSAGPEPEEQS